MKTRVFILFLSISACIGTISASDTQVDGIWYDLNNYTRTASVTYRGSFYSSYSNEYMGVVTIPTSVTYTGTTYSVTSIGDRAFYQCTGLTSIMIPNSVTSIGNSAFQGCTGLIKVNITDIAAWCNIAFGNNISNPLYNAHNLYVNDELVTDLVIPNSVTSIGGSAFQHCSGLTSVTIPNSVTSIGSDAFFLCSGLTSIDVASDNSNYCSVDGVLFNKDKTTLIQHPGGKQGAYTIPNSVTSIGDGAFAGCSGLTSVTIPNSVTSIGDGAFAGCSGLTSVTIPNSVTSIGDYGFYGCDGLTSVTNFANTPQEITSSVFDHVYKSTCVLYVPAGSISAYQSADQWKDFYNILPISSQGIEEIVENSSQDGKFIHDGQIFILRGEKVYSITGQEVK